MDIEKAIEILRARYERAMGLEWVRHPLPYAIYQTWKIVRREVEKND